MTGQRLLISSPLALCARSSVSHFSKLCIGYCGGGRRLCSCREGSSSPAEAGYIVGEWSIIRSCGNKLSSTRKQRSRHFYKYVKRRIRPPRYPVMKKSSCGSTKVERSVKLRVDFKLKSPRGYCRIAPNTAPFVCS